MTKNKRTCYCGKCEYCKKREYKTNHARMMYHLSVELDKKAEEVWARISKEPIVVHRFMQYEGEVFSVPSRNIKKRRKTKIL